MSKLIIVKDCKSCPMPKRAQDYNKLICLDCEADISINVKSGTISDACKKEDIPPSKDLKLFTTVVDCFKEAGLTIDTTQEYSVVGQLHELISGVDLVFKMKKKKCQSVNHSVATEKIC